MTRFIRKIYAQFVHWYIDEKRTLNLSWLFVVGISFYLPFEGFILRFLSFGSITINQIFKAIPEAIIYILFVILLKDIVLRRKKWQETPLDLLIVLFIIWWLLITLLTQISIITSIDNFREIIRFVALYYVLVNLKIPKRKIKYYLKIILIAMILECLIVSVQYFFPSVGDFFKGSLVDITVIKQAVQEGTISSLALPKPGAALGTFNTEGLLSMYLLIPSILVFLLAFFKSKNIIPDFKYQLFIILIVFAQFASYKRAALLITLCLPIITLIFLEKKRLALLLSWLYGFTIVALISILVVLSFQTELIVGAGFKAKESLDFISYMASLFSKENIIAMNNNSRLLFVRTVCGTVLTDGSWYGLGPDDNVVNKMVLESISNKDKKGISNSIIDETYKDVYWCSFIAYYGLPGLILYSLILMRLYQISKIVLYNSSFRGHQLLSLLLQITIIVGLFYSFAERVFINRCFSFYFWTIAGLTVNVFVGLKHTNTFTLSNKE